MSNWQFWITGCSEVLLLINTVLSVLYLWRSFDGFKYFVCFQVFTLIILVAAKLLWLEHEHNKAVNNLPLLHFYTLGEFIILTMYYHQIFKLIPIWRKYILSFVVVVIGLILANSIFLQPITTFNANAKTLTQVIFIGYSVFFFSKEIYNRTDFLFSILKTINSAILLYYAGSLFIFMFGNVLINLEQLHSLFWVANAVLYLIFQLLVFTAIWQFRQTKSTYS